MLSARQPYAAALRAPGLNADRRFSKTSDHARSFEWRFPQSRHTARDGERQASRLRRIPFFTRRKSCFTLRNVAMLQRAKISQYKKANSALRKNVIKSLILNEINLILYKT
jgi:hypothetical protein